MEDEKKVAYQGFNDGTVYPRKSGENYIYEGLILRFMKSRWTYNDATNVVGYYNSPVTRAENSISKELKGFDHDLFSGHKVVIDPATASPSLRSPTDVRKTLWVFRYYDLDDRKDFMRYGEALVRLITFIRTLAEQKDQGLPKVNIIAHSMGGLSCAKQCNEPIPKARPPSTSTRSSPSAPRTRGSRSRSPRLDRDQRGRRVGPVQPRSAESFR